MGDSDAVMRMHAPLEVDNPSVKHWNQNSPAGAIFPKNQIQCLNIIFHWTVLREGRETDDHPRPAESRYKTRCMALQSITHWIILSSYRFLLVAFTHVGLSWLAESRKSVLNRIPA